MSFSLSKDKLTFQFILLHTLFLVEDICSILLLIYLGLYYWLIMMLYYIPSWLLLLRLHYKKKQNFSALYFLPMHFLTTIFNQFSSQRGISYHTKLHKKNNTIFYSSVRKWLNWDALSHINIVRTFDINKMTLFLSRYFLPLLGGRF